MLIRIAFLCVPVILAYTSVSLADLPEPMQITYTLRENPANPHSPITFITRVDLTAVDADGDTVAWQVDQITIEENLGSSYRKWAEEDPSVDSMDGLWWIEHDDPEEPSIGEFADMPEIAGTATPLNIADPYLDYGVVAHDIPDSGGRTLTALSYSFDAVGAVAPETEEEDEDAEVDEGTDDPD